MSQSTIQDEIRELNLAYLMLAQHMLREDREAGMLRLGINAEVADLILSMSVAQLVRVAGNPMLVPRMRFDDPNLLSLLAGKGRDAVASGIHAAILATGKSMDELA